MTYLTSLTIDYFVEFYGWQQDNKDIRIFMESCHGYDKETAKDINNNAAAYTRSLLNAIAILHSKDIVHRDIKPENMLTCKNSKNRFKLTDFEYSTQQQIANDFMGTYEVAAPEHLHNAFKYNEKQFYSLKESDMFSVGATLGLAFDIMDEETYGAYKDITMSRYIRRFRCFNGFQSKWTDGTVDLTIKAQLVLLVQKLTSCIPKDRMTAVQALEFFKNNFHVY